MSLTTITKLLSQGKNKTPGITSSSDFAVVCTCMPPRSQPTIFDMDPDVLSLDDNSSPQRGPNACRPKDHTVEVSRAYNIVVFGDSGVGKSSLINMLAGRKTAITSSGVLGCTFQSSRYPITLDEEQVSVWDTAGFDEGTRGRVSPEVAEKSLTKLLQDLRKANGVHLLVYCIRGPSVRKSLARNYAVFYSAICRKKVPIVAVVTGLENEPVSMDDWWTRGGKELAKYKMHFDAHACVTTIDMNRAMGTVFEERSRYSQDMVRRLIIDQYRRSLTRSQVDSNIFIKDALRDFRSMVKSGWENTGPSAAVVFSQNDIQFIPRSSLGDPKQIHYQINGRLFVFHNACDTSGRYINLKLPKSGADLLIFAGLKTESNLRKFKEFYKSYGGEARPILVVTDGHDSVDSWTSYLKGKGIPAHVQPFPEDTRTQADLPSLIDEVCLVRGAIMSGKEKILKYLRRGSKENSVDFESAPVTTPSKS